MGGGKVENMIRKRTSKLLRLQSQPESPVTSRPASRAAPSPRTLVMSNADLWFSKPEEEEKLCESAFEPTFPQIVEENEPLFHDCFLSRSYEEKQPSFLLHNFDIPSPASFESPDDSSSNEYEDTLEDLDFDTESIASSEASVAVSIAVYNVGKPRLVDVSPPSSMTDLHSSYTLHSRQLSTSSRSSSNYSESRTFSSHHSASSSLSDCATPITPTTKSSRRSSLFTKPDIPPRSQSKHFKSSSPQQGVTKISRLSWTHQDDLLSDFYTDDQGLIWSFPIPGQYQD